MERASIKIWTESVHVAHGSVRMMQLFEVIKKGSALCKNAEVIGFNFQLPTNLKRQKFFDLDKVGNTFYLIV